MAEGDRYTFTALVSFLIQCENKLIEFYEAAAGKAEQTRLKSLFHTFSKRNLEHIDEMERARRQSLVEMALEPITGLRLSEHSAQIDAIIKSEKMESVEKAISLEKIMRKLYSEASSKVMNASADTGLLLSRLSQESADRGLVLESIL